MELQKVLEEFTDLLELYTRNAVDHYPKSIHSQLLLPIQSITNHKIFPIFRFLPDHILKVQNKYYPVLEFRQPDFPG